MLQVHATDRHRYCDGLTRRSFLRAGFLGVGGLSLADMLAWKARANEAGRGTRDTAVILIWLDGGPTHMDTYDLKPNAPAEYRGPLRGTCTNVAGIDICDLMPRQARLMDKLAIVRSLTHTTGDHFAGAHWMLTGYHGSTAANMDPMFPSAGSIAAKLRGPSQAGVPGYVAVPVAASVGLVPGYNSAAYLGAQYNPFQTGNDPNSPSFSVQNLRLPNGVTIGSLDDRRRLLSSFDGIRREVDRSGLFTSMDRFQQEAFEMISGPRARQAFDIHREDPRVRDRYGRHSWGQSCLLARRLVEAGVTFVTVHMGGWDDHAQIQRAMQNKLPIYDRALAGLVEDLVERGLYDRTAICVCGEFGRTPRVNQDAGRDHWGQAGFCILGGGGLRTGLVVGETNDKGEHPRTRHVSPGDMLATLYHVLGIDTRTVFYDRIGRPHPVLSQGTAIAELAG